MKMYICRLLKFNTMFKVRLYIPALFILGLVQAQTPEEQAKIINSYDSQKIENLTRHIQANQIAVQKRIDDYLSKNPSETQYFWVNGVGHRIVDIFNDRPIYQTTDNASAAMAIKTRNLYPGGSLGLSLEGEGMNIALWDEGWVLTTHNEFMQDGTSRVLTPDSIFPDPTANYHGTHVGGTIGAAGVNASAKGMAPKATIKSYTWGNDETEVATEAGTNGLLISNHSYGVPIYNNSGELNVPGPWYMGCYSTDARNWDLIAETYPHYLIVASAGNAGSENYTGGIAPGLDKLTGNKNSKNLLIVANANPTAHPVNGVTALSINPGSSQGPTDDGRIKPDIAADGTAVFSTINTGVADYDTASGTSMSSPSVAGTLLLLQEHYNNLYPSEFMQAATLKGLVCHTALDDYEVNPDFTPEGPDPRFGWGLLDASRAAILLTNSIGETPTSIVDELTLNQGDSYSFQVTVNSPKKLMATISWTDVAGTVKNGQLNSTTPVLVNDLDIRITKNTDTYYPWKLDLSNLNAAVKGDNIVDNIERVDINDAVGTYTIEVTHKGTLSGGSQNYSLIVSGFDQALLSNETFQADNLFVYPNPTTDLLYFDTTGDLSLDKVEVYDTIGKRVLSSQINNNSVDVSQLTAGVYFVKIYSGENQTTKKIIKK